MSGLAYCAYLVNFTLLVIVGSVAGSRVKTTDDNLILPMASAGDSRKAGWLGTDELPSSLLSFPPLSLSFSL